MKISLLFLIITFQILLFSCKGRDVISSSDNITLESTDINTFNKVSVSNGFKVYLENGNEPKVDIEASDNLHKYIKVKVVKDELQIHIDDKVRFDNSSNVKVFITYDLLNGINVSGGCTVYFENTYSQDNLSIDMSGGSILNGDLYCKYLDAEISGGGKLILTGVTESFNLDLSGGSTSESYDFAIDDLKCEISGGGNVKHTVNKTIDIDASGGSALYYKGDAIITKQDLSGGASVEKK